LKNLAVRYQTVSPESEFIERVLGDNADVYGPWDIPTSSYDVAICIGPVSSCPPAKKKILFVFGQVANHPDFDWDIVVTTSGMARDFSVKKFGHQVRAYKVIPPVLSASAGRRLLVDSRRGYIHASEMLCQSSSVKTFNIWGAKRSKIEIGTRARNDWQDLRPRFFSALEFNSLIRGGAVGYYPSSMADGYDVQVRRHLAFGGRVVCKKDKHVLGRACDFVDDIEVNHDLFELEPRKPKVWPETEKSYAKSIKEIIRRA